MAPGLNTRLNFFFIITAVLLQASAGILSKYAALSVPGGELFGMFASVYYILAILCLAGQAFVWQQALKHYRLSYAYPFLSLVNVIILVFSLLLFGETITPGNLIGTIAIAGGIYLLLGGRDEA